MSAGVYQGPFGMQGDGATGELPLVTVIVPCRNEKKWIGRCLDSIIWNDYPKERLEVLVVDGMSDDGTDAIVQSYSDRLCFLRNPRRTTPAALNAGIAAAKGAVIIRMDAHYEYPANYISQLVHKLLQSGADNVGGRLIMGPANESAMAQAIAVAVTHPFGIGNAYYRIGASGPRWVDTVPFGCYRSEVFDRIGLFDEDLVRNQDIELNLRLRRAGGRILLAPDVVLHGHARDSLGKLWRMYYQYGYFNPLVIRKSPGRPTLRQCATPLFVTALAASAFLAPWWFWARVALVMILLAYGTCVAASCALVAVRHGIRCALALSVVFPALHISHGLGFLKGLWDFTLLRRDLKKHWSAVPLTR